jgi:hypothetical protein
MTDQEIVDLANRVGKDLRGATFGEVCEYIDEVDVAWGVWQGGKTLIKGEEALRFISHRGVVEVASITAIPCRSVEEALAIKRCFEASRY